jgi:D-alanyl-lipoteichoic acid acyltransferase DltB (MBOAT superfamily)
MSNVPVFIISLLVYVLCARFALSLSNPRLRAGHFAIVNIVGFVWLSLLANYSEWKDETILSLGYEVVVRHLSLIGFYVLAVAAGYFLMRAFAKREGWLPWLAFFYPITLLILFKYLRFSWNPLLDRLDWDDWIIAATIIGLSYMAFRLSYLVLEVRNGAVETPTLSEYLGFAFFLPTMVVGPINPYSTHQRSIEAISETSVPIGRCLLRILVGATKYLFLANLANQLSYSGIFLDGKPHALIDLGVAIVFYYLFLYLNFSGFCDMAIGVAGLLGIRVKENFDNPFAAKNVKEFWNRWHITLSEYTRDVIFTPLSKALIKNFSVRYTNLSIAFTILIVFLVIGIWHGVGWTFVMFGLIHAVGVIANHYYTVWMKRVLGRERYKSYNENRLINAGAMVVTFCYVAASFAVFANSYNMMGIIKNALRAGL